MILNNSERRELLIGFRIGESHCFRIRCRAILLNADGLSAAKVGKQTEMTAPTVGGWVKRFEDEGVNGLYIRPDQGCKAIMDCLDEEAVRKPSNQTAQAFVPPKKLGRRLRARKRANNFQTFSALAQDIDV